MRRDTRGVKYRIADHANAVRISPLGRKQLRAGRAAAERVEKALLAMLTAADRTKLLKTLGMVVEAAESADPSTRKARRKNGR